MSNALSMVVRSLELRDRLSKEERHAVLQLIGREQTYSRGQDIVAEGSHLAESCLLMSGFAGREMVLQSGRRQITMVQVPGDFAAFMV